MYRVIETKLSLKLASKHLYSERFAQDQPRLPSTDTFNNSLEVRQGVKYQFRIPDNGKTEVRVYGIRSRRKPANFPGRRAEAVIYRVTAAVILAAK